MLLRKIYVASSNKTKGSPQVKCPKLNGKQRRFVCLWSSLHAQFAYTNPNDRKVVAHFLCFRKRCCKTPDESQAESIRDEAISMKYYECKSVFLPVLSRMQ